MVGRIVGSGRRAFRPGRMHLEAYHSACQQAFFATLTAARAARFLGFCQPFRPPASVIPFVIHSGGQTGVDRAALDAAMARGVAVGGWCPQGRRAEDGPLPARYPLTETGSAEYAERTLLNVREADATLVLTRDDPNDGTALTIETARALAKPLLVVDLGAGKEVAPVAAWLREEGVRVLNVAGPRESTVPGIYADARAFIDRLLDALGYH